AAVCRAPEAGFLLQIKKCLVTDRRDFRCGCAKVVLGFAFCYFLVGIASPLDAALAVNRRNRVAFERHAAAWDELLIGRRKSNRMAGGARLDGLPADRAC